MKNRFKHGGNIEEAARLFAVAEEKITDFSSNVNPLALPAKVIKAIKESIRFIPRYPDPDSLKLKKALGKKFGIGTEHIVVGNGSIDLIYRAAQVLRPGAAVILTPTFMEYENALLSAGSKIRRLAASERDKFIFPIDEIEKNSGDVDIVFICNPNNPTGALTAKSDLEYLAKRLRQKKTTLVVDEAFIDLAEGHSLVERAAESGNLLVLRSMTKFYGLAGLRLGYAVGSKKLINRIRNFGPPWAVNMFAQVAGEAIIGDEEFKKKSLRRLVEERNFLYSHLSRIQELKPFQSQANFILVKIEGSLPSGQLQEKLLEHRLLVRDCSNFYGLTNKYIRVAVKGRKENLRLVKALQEVFAEE